ncbi:uncharacterized protein N7496_011095 [Penicillium cataractarum]|uniref:Heterokaryon incompatibility domain-containing protein n=1 Tax=Penicillium cataractarum TaxID=2100454 RepID=A0A9W9REU2_9EURO|nr:uncharacterized protein N7496_011095 [Penicillium cataractarum]KAJ5358682.1 hypothetical protein N7496_011095 [Penicillium cataractarum]
MAESPFIPPPDPKHPRWLLDLLNWQVVPYKEVASQVQNNGYGIISYTWGMWADFDTPVKNPPTYRVEGKTTDLPWQIPTVAGLDLAHARKILDSCLRTQYVWWDWMCVPQGQSNRRITLPDEKLKSVKGDEISKQLWHEADSLRLQTYLKEGIGQETFEEVLCDLHISLRLIQEQEPWLTSGWTLQEGVLLQDSLLRDYSGESLPCDFIPSSDAAVKHLSLPVTGLADDIAKAFLMYSEGWTTSQGMPQGVAEKVKQAIDYLGTNNDDSQAKYERAATFFTDLIRSGLVCYWSGNPMVLYILSGAASRRFTMPEDRCWALLGALELQLDNGRMPWYDYNLNRTPEERATHLRAVKTAFFIPLLRRYQWELFLVPRVEDPTYHTLSWPEKVVHGGVMPLSLFFIKDIYTDLPILEYIEATDEIISRSKSSGCTPNPTEMKYVQLTEDVFVRRYKQRRLDPSEPIRPRGTIEVDQIRREERSGLIYLPVMDIPVPDASRLGLENSWDNVEHGKRCVEIQLADQGENCGYFRGIVDLWGTSNAFEAIGYGEFKFQSKRKSSAKQAGRCVMA